MSFRLRPVIEADYPRIVEIVNSLASEPTTLADWQRQVAIRPKEAPVIRLVGITEAGTIAGYGSATAGPLNEPGTSGIGIRVAAEYQGRGLGGQFLQALEPWALEQGAQKLDTGVEERMAESVAWAERRGYQKRQHLFKSKLPLAGFDPSPFLAPLERAQREGFRLVSLAELGAGEESYRQLFDFYNDTGRDVPGHEKMPEISFELFVKAVVENPRFDPSATFVAQDGDRWAALAHLIRQTDGSYYHQYTGVRREYRGRELSKAVKLMALRWAVANDVPALVTHNDSTNQRMLAVNQKMGYQPEPGMFMMRKLVAG